MSGSSFLFDLILLIMFSNILLYNMNLQYKFLDCSVCVAYKDLLSDTRYIFLYILQFNSWSEGDELYYEVTSTIYSTVIKKCPTTLMKIPSDEPVELVRCTETERLVEFVRLLLRQYRPSSNNACNYSQYVESFNTRW